MNSRDLTVVLLVILGAVVLLPVLGMTLWGFGGMGPGMMGPGMMGGGDGRGFGFAGGGILTLLLLIAGIVLVVMAFTRKEPRGEGPLGVLKARLASGEITKEQYEELKRILQ